MSIATQRKPPKVRNVQPDELEDFSIADSIRKLDYIDWFTHCLNGYECKRTKESMVFYRVIFNEETSFPSVCEVIKIIANLTIQQQCEGNTVTPPKWMIQWHNGKLTRINTLQSFPNYFASARENLPHSMLNELKAREIYQAKGCPLYAAAINANYPLRTAPEIPVAPGVEAFTCWVSTSVPISHAKASTE